MGLRPPVVTFIFLKALSFLWPCPFLSATSRPLFVSADSTFTFLAVCILASHTPILPSPSLHPPLYQALPMTGCGYRCWGEPDSGGRTRVPFFAALS